MDEARKMLDRLDRIERLTRDEAPAPAVLAEMRELLVEAEAWTRAEAACGTRAETAVEELREALDGRAETALAAERTLLA